jgi:hypothetical protein
MRKKWWLGIHGAVASVDVKLPLKPFNAVPVVKGPWGKPLPTCETQQEAVAGTLAADQDVAAVYDPLTFLMESIYF